MYGYSGPRAFLKAETLWVRLFSSTMVSGHTDCISSSLSTVCPLFCTSTIRVSMALGVRGSGAPSLSSICSALSRLKGPNSYMYLDDLDLGLDAFMASSATFHLILITCHLLSA